MGKGIISVGVLGVIGKVFGGAGGGEGRVWLEIGGLMVGFGRGDERGGEGGRGSRWDGGVAFWGGMRREKAGEGNVQHGSLT